MPDYIGYADVEPPLVPSTWLGFFERGVPLSTNRRAGCRRTRRPRRRSRRRKRTRLRLRTLRTTLAAGVLAAAVVPVWAGPAAADHDAPCSVGEVPGSERLADTHSKDNPAFDRMHVEQAQELATGRA